jgi:S1-C subfamily serine protease
LRWIGLLLLVAVSGAWAGGVYRWVDAQGRVHFSDKPPPGRDVQAQESLEQLRLQDAFGTFKIPVRLPIRNPGDGRSVSLERLEVRLDAANSKGVTAGRIFAGESCDVAASVQWNEGALDLSDAQLADRVVQRFADQGWPVSASGAGGRLSLNAEIVDLKLDQCVYLERDYWPANRERAARAYMKVRWTLTDAGDEIFRATSEGAADGWQSMDKAEAVIIRAIEQAADNALGDRDFADAMRGGPDAYGVRGERAGIAVEPASEPLKLGLTWGARDARFQDRSQVLLAATVTVRTRRGHGSGVVIDAAGYALTNAHVVGDERQVTVLTRTGALVAEVVRRDRRADVALLRFAAADSASAPIGSVEPRPGDVLYVVGTPLDESLSHTVTQGILSATRDLEGRRLYQTDAQINPGNSGGPVFDAAGELVALSASGLFTRQGASVGVNYLIPIGAALEAAGVQPR